MPSILDNATRIKTFRELKATLRSRRDRLLVGIDIAKAQHVAQVRLAHTRIVEPKLTIPNTQAGFATFWARLAGHQTTLHVPEIICAVEPTGTYHPALATFLEQQGATVVFVNNHVAHLNRRTLDGKNDPKDAHTLCDLLEQGKVLFYSRPDEPLGALRHLVRVLRRARGELSACKTRFTTTLLPPCGPMGDPVPAAVLAALPAPLQGLVPRARRARGAAGGALPPGLAAACADLAAQLTAVQARITGLEVELVRCRPTASSAPSPGSARRWGRSSWRRSGTSGGTTHFAQLRKLAGLDILTVESGQYRGTGRISKAGRALLRWALYQAALGAARTRAGRAWLDALRAKRAGDRFAFFKAAVELAAKLLRTVWGVWRSGRPYDPARALGLPAPARPRPAGAGARRPRSGSRSWPGRTGCGSRCARRRSRAKPYLACGPGER